MPNLDKVVHNDDLNAVTEMPPTMSDAYIDSVEADKAVEDIIKPAEEIIKEKPFLGASKQPVPKEPEEAKITLDEGLFDYFEVDDDWEDAAWHDTADQEEEEDIPEDILKDYINSIEVEEEDIEESCDKEEIKECDQTELVEDGRSQSLLRQLDDTDIEEEEFDLWTLVYSSLINKPDEATWKAMQKYDTVILPKKLRYDTINSDSDGNIIVYGKTEKDLDGAKLVADLYELEYEVKPSRESWAKQHPEQSFSLTIKIPEEEITDIDKYFKKDE